jgi:hypothetical protein
MNNHCENISKVLVQMNLNKNFTTRSRVGRCWLAILRMRKDVFEAFSNSLFGFFFDNLSAESYEMNFTAGEFFLFIIEEENGQLMKNEIILEELIKNIKKYYFIYNF